jgi:hypothetical protein
VSLTRPKVSENAPQRVDPSAGLKHNDDEDVAEICVTVGCCTYGVELRFRAANLPVQEDVDVNVRQRHYPMLFIDNPILAQALALDAGYSRIIMSCPLLKFHGIHHSKVACIMETGSGELGAGAGGYVKTRYWGLNACGTIHWWKVGAQELLTFCCEYLVVNSLEPYGSGLPLTES